jgi:hypothetical protein
MISAMQAVMHDSDSKIQLLASRIKKKKKEISIIFQAAKEPSH